jgi:hypothetical protein
VVATQPSLKYLLRAPSLAISDRPAGALRRGDRSQHCGVDHRPTAIRVEVQQALWRRRFGSRVPEGAEPFIAGRGMPLSSAAQSGSVEFALSRKGIVLDCGCWQTALVVTGTGDHDVPRRSDAAPR